MKNEAEANAEEDKKQREKVDKLNAADNLVFQTEKQLSEYGDKLPVDKKETIDKAVAELKEAHKSEDLERVDAATEKLNEAWQAASQDIYNATQQAEGAQGGAEQAQGGDGAESSGGDDVTDVEFEEVDEDKKK